MNLPILQPGDHLLYDVDSWSDPWSSLVDWAIRVKTWSTAAHIEVFDSGGLGLQFALASRTTGVNRYPFRAQGLRYVLRPANWNHARAVYWFEKTARGQKYDWLGLFCFTLAVKRGSPDRMFCSEFARNLDRPAMCQSFADSWPGDKTAPGSYLMSPAFDLIYDSKQS
jgi:hypothetical protein